MKENKFSVRKSTKKGCTNLCMYVIQRNSSTTDLCFLFFGSATYHITFESCTFVILSFFVFLHQQQLSTYTNLNGLAATNTIISPKSIPQSHYKLWQIQHPFFYIHICLILMLVLLSVFMLTMVIWALVIITITLKLSLPSIVPEFCSLSLLITAIFILLLLSKLSSNNCKLAH